MSDWILVFSKISLIISATATVARIWITRIKIDKLYAERFIPTDDEEAEEPK